MSTGFADRVLWYTIFISASTAYYVALYPFASTLAKYRANYAPKRIELEQEEHQRASVAGASSYFAMMRRVKRLDGMAGFYKGVIPNLLNTILLLFIVWLSWNGLTVLIFTGDLWHKFTVSLLGEIIFLPIRVIVFRAITTPYKLPWFNPALSSRVLLSATERKYPWLLFLTPGLLISVVLLVIHECFIMALVIATIPSVSRGSIRHSFGRSTPAQISISMVGSVVSVIIGCPLSVVSSRLMIQRNHLPRDYETIVQEGQADSSNAVYSGEGDDVVQLRSEGDPYNGFVDCVRRIISEEGYPTLFRAWWLDLIVLWFANLVMPWLQSLSV